MRTSREEVQKMARRPFIVKYTIGNVKNPGNWHIGADSEGDAILKACIAFKKYSSFKVLSVVDVLVESNIKPKKKNK